MVEFMTEETLREDERGGTTLRGKETRACDDIDVEILRNWRKMK